MQRPSAHQHIESIYPPPPTIAAAPSPATVAVDSLQTENAMGIAGRVISDASAYTASSTFNEPAPPNESVSEGKSTSQSAARNDGAAPASDYGEDEEDEGYEEEDQNNAGPNYLKSKYWWAGMILMVSGEVGNFLGMFPCMCFFIMGVVPPIIKGAGRYAAVGYTIGWLTNRKYDPTVGNFSRRRTSSGIGFP
ncbi:MAG: hypothetical protein BJ554DRAFT_4248 [Olpidium bornovanus]|uniref:Uncharacterized protein n=1 Tax=Olpidium bornovanus TaxID=278681 RepID=A0A8H7ZND2_9FUNG|nr:MAG: hypothetical protein BJ554DRAFT_4248 [Olpidium bornovanus]